MFNTTQKIIQTNQYTVYKNPLVKNIVLFYRQSAVMSYHCGAENILHK